MHMETTVCTCHFFSFYSYGPREVTRRDEWSMRGQLMCEFKFATFSRQQHQGHQQSAEEKDLSAIIQDALIPAVCLVSKEKK